MRTIIIGDIHGCYVELIQLLAKIEFDKDSDKLISLGDLMDRGKYSYEVFCFFREIRHKMGERCVIVRGNHEQMMMDAVNPADRGLWKQNGGTKTIRSFCKHKDNVYRNVRWFQENTVLYYEDELFQCVHAGLDEEKVSENLPEYLLWDRTRIERNDYCGKLTIVGHTPMKYAIYGAGDEEKVTVLSEKRWKQLPEYGLIDIDTGCVYGYKLTAMIIEGNEYSLESVCKNE